MLVWRASKKKEITLKEDDNGKKGEKYVCEITL